MGNNEAHLTNHTYQLVKQNNVYCLHYFVTHEYISYPIEAKCKTVWNLENLKNFSCNLPVWKCEILEVFPSSSESVFFFNFYFIFKLYNIVLVLPNIKMNPPHVYLCSPSWTLLPPSAPYPPSGSSQCTSPKHPVSCIKPGLTTRFIHDIIHVSMPFSQISPPSPSPSPSSNEMGETGTYYTEWSKPERKTPIQYTNTYIWNLERW